MDNTNRSELLPLIRSQVKDRLTASSAFKSLPRDQQTAIAHDTVKALHYILGGEDGRTIPRSMTLAGNQGAFGGGAVGEAMAGAAAKPAPGQPVPGRNRREQRDGLGEAARAGSQAFTEMVADINFPAFVAGLIDGVFNSIVTTSIKQMEAYAELVKNVSKSVDQYMRDNVSENHARDYLAEKYPNHLQLDFEGEKPRVKPKEGYDDQNLPDFFKDLGLKAPVTSLDEDNVEQELVPAARRRIAMDRQQLLATMVMMGVNRLVVTNGTIEASCMFELDTTDFVRRSAQRTAVSESASERAGEWGGEGSYSEDGKFKRGSVAWQNNRVNYQGREGDYEYSNSWYNKGSRKDTAKFNVTTVQNQSSDQTIEMHAKLGGKVKVNFKSDYFPMERMVDVLQINQIKDKAQSGVAPQQQQPALPPPPMPAMPQLPGVPGAAPAAPAPAPASGART